jgi:hypothetical protein
MLYPDGTPVSYTEAAAFRRYLGHGDDFLYLNTWLQPAVTAAENYFTWQQLGIRMEASSNGKRRRR